MRVLLISPKQGTIRTCEHGRSTVCEPLGLEYIAGMVRKSGHKTELLWNPTIKRTEKLVRSFLPDAVCFSVYSCGIDMTASLVKAIRQIRPETSLIYGGPHPSATTNMLDMDPRGISVAGEAEGVICDILMNLSSPEKLEELRGVYCHHLGPDEVPQIAHPPTWDHIAWPYRNAAWLRKCGTGTLSFPPPSKQQGMAALLASRGCPFNCYYCGMETIHGRGVRIRGYDDLTAEIEWIQTEYGVKNFFFVDPTFNLSPQHVDSVMDAISKSAPGATWTAHLSLSLLTRHMAETMADHGCTKLLIGIESIDDGRLRKLKGRPFETQDTMFEKLMWISDRGILTRGYYMIGFPDDTEEGLLSITDRIGQLPVDELHVTYYTPTPGTKAFYDTGINWICPDDRYSGITLHNPAIISNSISIARVKKWRYQILQSFYNSAPYKKRTAEKMRRFSHLQPAFGEFFSQLEQWGYV